MNDNDSSRPVTRRRLLTVGAVVPITSITHATVLKGDVPWQEGRATPPAEALQAPPPPQSYLFLVPAEVAFIEAAVARLIPDDELGPGALTAGVPTFIDRQLAGDYGRGTRWYMQGPWAQGESTQGWQTRMSPSRLYRAALREIDAATTRAARQPFARLAPTEQDHWLRMLEHGEVELGAGVDAKAFFKLLWQNTLEGYWSDPVYGGNRDMAGWKLIGFPGARYDLSAYVDKHGEPYPLPPVGLRGRADWNRVG